MEGVRSRERERGEKRGGRGKVKRKVTKDADGTIREVFCSRIIHRFVLMTSSENMVIYIFLKNYLVLQPSLNVL